MRIALAQINPTVGDIAGNVARVVEALKAAERGGADITLLPELALTGYPPEDLLAKEHFVAQNLYALEQVAASCRRAALVGFVDKEKDRLYNAAAFISAGQIVRVYRKRHLPNYGVFDERRYFTAGDDPDVFEFEGQCFASTICEDLWIPELVSDLASSGANIVLNISASPFHAGKGQEREKMLCTRARDNGLWVAYCNLVGGQDELVFDGRSVVVSPDGEVIARAASFAEDLAFADLDYDGATPVSRTSVKPMLDADEETYRALLVGLRDYALKNGFTDVTLGLSGGIDSALVAAIAVDALGPAHVHGVLMPGPYSSEGSVRDARELAAALGIDTIELSIESPFEAILDILAPVFGDRPADVTEENLQARVRGMLLMALSNKFGWLVLATGNKSELSVGYSTLYGDMVGGFAPIKDVLKSRVYELARWRNRERAVIPEASLAKEPSAELRPGQIDQDSLPPYDVLDAVIALYIEQDLAVDEIVTRGYERETVEWIASLVDGAEYKRRQSAPGTKITPKAFGKDRRMPLTNRFRG